GDGVVVALGAAGGHTAAIQCRTAGSVGGDTSERRAAADGTAEGGRAGGVDRQTEAAVDRGRKADVAAAGRGQGGRGVEGDGIVVALGAAGRDAAAIQRGAARGVGGDAGQRRATANG